MVCVGRVDSLRIYFPVHCRIGSLENEGETDIEADTVHCRIGSLEIIKQKHWQEANVHCRIGSLEKRLALLDVDVLVHCRIGSLEKLHTQVQLGSFCSLPHRQFRNAH